MLWVVVSHVVLAMIVEFESRASTEISVICDMAVAAVNASTKAADACKEHVKKVKAAMGAASADVSEPCSIFDCNAVIYKSDGKFGSL